ncbi:twin-arginine translocase subunit TatC [Hydrogenovibrio sp. 3SP14C1]|uniref:twin-arginine translocase subunit TatC n=1 Tax=Hydrogenovibrio sp. 3SP14C1 TaxID=3038774 RepID=UPI0024162134|nr:twin-arginine translocase subunit TatC [Hydrogenovibrio sp. 3SP14C1]MDG4811401.1 twin-arginine translocase subunit TatC [Hydrogenovibrio sp. 3SP14C1]
MSQSAIPPNDQEMTLVQHLLEFRNSVTKGILAILILFVILFPFANDLYLYISEPLSRFLPEGTSMIATGVASPFLTPFKLSLVLAIYLAMPFLLFQVWSFIAPALYHHEKQLVGPLLFFSSFLFYAGGAFAYYVVFPLVFGFLSTAAPEGVTVATDISLYLDFVIKMFFAFGIAFEVPIVVVLLILTRMASPQKLSHARPYVVVGAFVIGMLLTPPDIVSQTLLAIPMWLLYETGIIVGKAVLKARRQKEEDELEEEDETAPKQKPTASGQSNQATSSKSEETDPYAIAEEDFDNRYADQLEDDEDWDKTFDEIDSEFSILEQEYKKRKEAEQAEKDAKNEEAKKEDDQSPSDSTQNESSDTSTKSDK